MVWFFLRNYGVEQGVAVVHFVSTGQKGNNRVNDNNRFVQYSLPSRFYIEDFLSYVSR